MFRRAKRDDVGGSIGASDYNTGWDNVTVCRRFSIIAYSTIFVVAANAQTNEELRSTCAGYIAVMNAAARTGDPLGPQAYLDLADKMYEAVNEALVSRGVQPLPIPHDANSQARRGMVVVYECKANMALKYGEAVTYAYIKMRQEEGLSTALPQH